MTRIKTSPYLRIVPGNESTVVYHSLYGNPVKITPEIATLLPQLALPVSLEELLEARPECFNMLEDLIRLGFIIPEDRDERTAWKQSIQERYRSSGLFFSGVVLMLTSECNFNCSYCVSRETLPTPLQMSFETARQAMDFYIQYQRASWPETRKTTLIFTGGEPLLQWKLLQQVVEYSSGKYPEEDFGFRIITNGSLITAAVARFLRKYRFEVIISLDGSYPFNDRTRWFMDGTGTHEAIWDGLTNLLKTGHDQIAVSSVYCEANQAGFQESFFQELAGRHLQSIALNPDNLSAFKESPVELAQHFHQLRQQAAGWGIQLGGVWTVPARNLRSTSPEWAFCSGAARSRLFVQPDGSVPFCEYHHRMLGRLESFTEIVQNFQQQPNSYLFGEWTRCRGCEIEGFCSPCALEDEVFYQGDQGPQDAKCRFLKECTRLLLSE